MRDARLDYIRALAIFFVIMVHTWSLSGIEGACTGVSKLYHVLATNGVPMFIMLSGALVLGSKPTSIRQFYHKRFARLLIPFAIWSTIVYVVSCAIGKYPDISTFPNALGHYLPYLLENKINTAYWYVQMIAVLYLLTPFLQRALEGLSLKHLGILLAIGGAFLAIKELYPAMYLAELFSNLPYYLLYYIFGYWAYQTIGGKAKNTLYISVIALVISIAGYVLTKSEFFNWTEAMALFALLLHLPNQSSRWIKAIGDCSYAIYLSHFMLVRPIYQVLHWDMSAVQDAPIWQLALLPTGVAIVILLVFTSLFLIVQKALPKAYLLGISAPSIKTPK